MVEAKHKWKAWIFLAPALVLLAIFTVYPIFNTVRLAFLDGYNMSGAINGKVYPFGVANFTRVVNAPSFLSALKTTTLLCVLTVPISTILALFIAVVLNSIKPLKRLLQTIFFLPYVTNSIAIGMVFAAMFNMVGMVSGGSPDSIGLINTMLGWFGVDYINWINVGSSYAANIAVMVVYITWNALPFKILVLLGGLQGINKQYYDAAKVDGTPRWRVLTRVTIPLLSPMLSYVLITSFMGGFKEYSSVVGVFGAKMGPGDNGSLQTIVGMVYDSLQYNKTGEASAASLILFCIILVITLINLYVSKKNVHYS